MCGIAGFLETRSDRVGPQSAVERLRAMATMIAHRGPDDEDVMWSRPVGLAHRRLSIIDPAPHGRQPMRRGALTIVYNGEIYNYRELRNELEGAGAAFRTHTDTEVLLAAFERWGEAAIDRLNGMFAFALWNESDRTLLLARDRLGEKPLYYAQLDDAFLFGSEIKALLVWPDLARAPNLEAIHHFLSLQYVPAPFTAFKGVNALPAACLMRVSSNGEMTLRKYWQAPVPELRDPLTPRQMEEKAEDLQSLLAAVVKKRMVADVPVGAFLSGGVDSSGVAALMAGATEKPINTFTIGFENPDYDERRYSRIVADRIGANHTEEVVRPDAVALLPEIVWHYGQPFADPSAVPTYYVSRLARSAVTVVLNGDGGDELFMGYDRYRDLAAFDNDSIRNARPVRSAARLVASLMPDVLARHRPFGGVRRRLANLGATPIERYETAIMYFSDRDKIAAYGERLQPFLKGSTLELLSEYFDASPTIASGAAFADLNTYLPDDLLVKVDVASMAFGLEARAPFLDHELVEWAAKLPESAKLSEGRQKKVLKAALHNLLPAEILDRPKMGFGVPIDKWFRDDLREFTTDILSSEAARNRGLIDPDYAMKLLDDHVSGRRLNHTRLWALLNLELWHRTWIDGPIPLKRGSGA